METTHFDLLVIGFGKGGKTLAASMGQLGKRVAMVEQSSAMYGGTVWKGEQAVMSGRDIECGEQAGTDIESLASICGTEFGPGPIGARVTRGAVRVTRPAYGRLS